MPKKKSAVEDFAKGLLKSYAYKAAQDVLTPSVRRKKAPPRPLLKEETEKVTTLDHDDLTNVTSDQHHNRGHIIFSSTDHTDTQTSNGVADGDLIYRTASKWKNLAKGANGKLLTMVADLPTWSDLTVEQITSKNVYQFSQDPVNATGYMPAGGIACDAASGAQPASSGSIIGLAVNCAIIIFDPFPPSDITFTVYLNGVATNLSVTFDAGTGLALSDTQAPGIDTFSANDILTVYVSIRGTPTAASVHAHVITVT